MPDSPSVAVLEPEAVHRARLDNGLTVLVLPDPMIPSLAFHSAWRVGSRNERPGITGISHLFEHMMFNGAKKYGPKQFDQLIESNGGTSNAYTTHDITAYHEVVPSEALDLVLDLELDRMRDLDLTERNLGSERQVVMEERRLRVDENPWALALEHLHALAYLAHPYQWPVIGWMADIEAISVRDINEYFRLHYQPSQATVVVAGAVDGPRTVERVSEVLGQLRPGPAVPPVVRSEPPQRGPRRGIVRKEAQLATSWLGYHAVDAASPDLPVLDVIQTLLIDGDSSRLQRRLVLDEATAVDVQVDAPWSLDPGLFKVAVTVRPGAEVERVEATVVEELDRLTREPVPPEEIAKAKNQLKAHLFRRLKTNEGRADLLAESEILFGSCDTLFSLADRFEAVTDDDVQRVARDVFRPENGTAVTLEPLQRGEGAA